VFFFIVPDVWLSLLARKSLRHALVASLYALAGALCGGILIHVWASHDPATVTALIEKVPAISSGMIEQVRADLEQQGAWAIVTGPLQGIPYKTFASQAPEAGIPLATLLAYSIPARLLRFFAVTLLCYAGVRLLERWFSSNSVLRALLGCWIAFYGFYFWHMPG
jgi:hypothetical protein